MDGAEAEVIGATVAAGTNLATALVDHVIESAIKHLQLCERYWNFASSLCHTHARSSGNTLAGTRERARKLTLIKPSGDANTCTHARGMQRAT